MCTMLKFIILVAFLANIHFVLTDDEIISEVTSNESIATSSVDDESCDSEIRSKCGPNQVFEICPSTCPPRTCRTKDIAFRCAEPLKPGDPNCPRPGCRCADGFYSNNEGKCVSKEQCPKLNCGTDEVYVACPVPTCANQTCENIGKIFECPEIPANYPCKPECRCKEGYYRNKIGECISEEDCKKCPGEFEYFSCGNACDNECDKLSIQSHANCPIINIQCNRMCYCLEGYARDAKNKCIPISQCPPIKCGVHEVISTCANSPCIRNCATKDLNLQCKPYPPGCKTGCVCADGYLRDNNNVCVPIKKCPPNKEPVDVCLLPPVTGNCRASITEYYYDHVKKDCFTFIWGGCGGNGNKFDTKAECLKKCRK